MKYEDESDELIKNLLYLQLNLIKEIYEGIGLDLSDTNNEVEYINYLKSNPIDLSKK